MLSPFRKSNLSSHYKLILQFYMFNLCDISPKVILISLHLIFNYLLLLILISLSKISLSVYSTIFKTFTTWSTRFIFNNSTLFVATSVTKYLFAIRNLYFEAQIYLKDFLLYPICHNFNVPKIVVNIL